MIEMALRSCFYPNLQIMQEWKESSIIEFMQQHEFKILNDKILYKNEVIGYKNKNDWTIIHDNVKVNISINFKQMLLEICIIYNLITTKEHYYLAEYSTECVYNHGVMHWENFKRPYLYDDHPYKLIVQRNLINYNQKQMLTQWCDENIKSYKYHHAIWCFANDLDCSLFLLRWNNITNIN